MVIKLLMIYKKRMRYHLTAHPLFIFYGFLKKSLLLVTTQHPYRKLLVNKA